MAAVTERQVLAALMVGVDLDDRPSARLRPAWMADGACCEHPEVEFVPPSTRTEDGADEARAICAGCLCHAECLAYALSDPTLLGIWAGTTTAERRVMRRRLMKRAS